MTIDSTTRSTFLQQGIELYQEHKLTEASLVFLKLINSNPNDAEALHLLGIVYQHQNNVVAAIELLQRSLQINPYQPHVYNNLGNMYGDVGQSEAALVQYEQAISLEPTFFDAINNKALTLSILKRFDEALIAYELALSIHATSPAVYFNKGLTLDELGLFESALISYSKAIEFKPDFAECHNNKGVTLKELKQCKDAIVSYNEAIRLNPNYAEAYNNRGIAYKELRNYSQALEDYNQAISIDPQNPEFLWNKSQLLLLLGQYEEGWQLYEQRWKKDSFRQLKKNFNKPMWHGESTISGRILLHAEQGLGDTIQMLRYIPMVAMLGWTVIVQVPASLQAIAQQTVGASLVITSNQPIPHFDVHAPMMSLPFIFKTTLQSIPSNLPYIVVDPKRQSAWKARLGDKKNLRVALTWAGSPHHKNDYNRSISLKYFLPLLSLNADFYSLQKELRTGDQEILKKELRLKDFTSFFSDFSETAAFINEMDLVISVDTSVLHLAGALGKSAWALLLYSADFRWLTDRSDSPWYPSLTLFRQQSIADWNGVCSNVYHELSKRLS